MTTGIAPVHTPAAVVVVDLVCSSEVWLGVVLDTAFHESPVDVVEVGFRDEERVVLRMYRLVVGDLGEIESGTVLDRYRKEGAEAARRGQTHDLAEESSGLLRVTGMNDGVVERNRHVHILSRDHRPRTSPGERCSAAPRNGTTPIHWPLT